VRPLIGCAEIDQGFGQRNINSARRHHLLDDPAAAQDGQFQIAATQLRSSKSGKENANAKEKSSNRAQNPEIRLAP
jgi:hypothetical protein